MKTLKDYPKKLRDIIKDRAGNNYNENFGLLSQFLLHIQPEGFEHWFEILEKYEADTLSEILSDEFLNFDALDDIEVNEPEIVSDSIVDKVVDSFKERSKAGIKKYGVTLDRGDLSPLEWISHLQQELQDAILYAEKLKTAKCICKSSDMAEDKETTYPLLKVQRVCIKSPIGNMSFGVNEVSLKYSLDGKTVTLNIV